MEQHVQVIKNPVSPMHTYPERPWGFVQVGNIRVASTNTDV